MSSRPDQTLLGVVEYVLSRQYRYPPSVPVARLSIDSIHAAEKQTGLGLPSALIEWWNDVAATAAIAADLPILPDQFSLMTLLEAVSTRSSLLNWAEGVLSAANASDLLDVMSRAVTDAAGTPSYGFWLSAWLPIASDSAGDYLFVDLRGGPKRGCVSYYMRSQGALDEPLWKGVSEMIDALSSSFRNGSPIMGMSPTISNSGVTWG